MLTDRQTDVRHINLIGGFVTRNPPKNSAELILFGYCKPIIGLQLVKPWTLQKRDMGRFSTAGVSGYIVYRYWQYLLFWNMVVDIDD